MKKIYIDPEFEIHSLLSAAEFLFASNDEPSTPGTGSTPENWGDGDEGDGGDGFESEPQDPWA